MKNTINIYVTAVILLINSNAFAETTRRRVNLDEPTEQEEPEPKKTKRSLRPDPTPRRLSEDNRKEKSFAMAGRLGAMGPSSAGFGIEAYKLIDGNMQIGGTLMSGSGSSASDIQAKSKNFSFVSKADITSTLVAAQARWFFSNSFEGGALAGIATNKIDYEIGYSSQPVAGTVKSTSVVAGGFIGNHWTFDSGFTIGCDWVGFMVPLASSFSESSTTSSSASADDIQLRDDVITSSKDHLASPYAIGLLLSVGGHF